MVLPPYEEDAEGPPGGRGVPPWVTRVSRWSWAFVGFSIALATIVVLAAALNELVVPLVVAVVAAVVFAPTVDRLEQHRVPRAIGAAAMTLMIVAASIGIVVLVAVGVVDHADELSDRLDAAWAELADSIDTPAISDYFDGRSTDLGPPATTLVRGVGTHIGSLIGSAVGFMSGLVLALVILYYLLKDGRSMVQQSIERRPEHLREQSARIMRHSAQTLRNNARGRTALAAVQGIAVFVVLTVLDVPLAATIGIVNFIGAFVPYLGAFLGGAFAVLMALSEGGIPLALAALVAVLFVNLVLENLLEPRLIGSSMRLRPVVVLLATVAGGLVAGLVGLILGAPTYAIVSNLLRELRSTGFFADVEPRHPAHDEPEA